MSEATWEIALQENLNPPWRINFEYNLVTPPKKWKIGKPENIK